MIRRLRLRKQRGFTLVELMIVVAIIGILAALAVYGVKRYLTSAKTGEARANLGRLGKDAAAAYQREAMPGSVLAEGSSANAVHRLCMSATAVPAAIPANQKVQPAAGEWGGNKTTGWTCLRFAIMDPIYYQYNYTSDATATTAGTTFTGFAAGDLDGDSTAATWTIGGAIDGTSREVRVAPTVEEPEDPQE